VCQAALSSLPGNNGVEPALSATTKRRFRQRIVLPGVKAADTAIAFLEYAT
jgi:hypothetical protein